MNIIKYNSLYKNLGNFYKMVVNISNLDLNFIPTQQKLYYAEKKNIQHKLKIPS